MIDDVLRNILSVKLQKVCLLFYCILICQSSPPPQPITAVEVRAILAGNYLSSRGKITFYLANFLSLCFLIVTSNGAEIKIEEYAPQTTPIIIASAKAFVTSPPTK